MNVNKRLAQIVQEEDREALRRLVEDGSCNQLSAFFEILTPMPYFQNFELAKERAFIELFKTLLKNQNETMENRLALLPQIESYVFVNGFNEKKALKQLEASQQAPRVMQLGNGVFKVYNVGGTYIGVVKAGVGTAALSTMSKALQVSNPKKAIYIGTCVSLDDTLQNGLTVIDRCAGTVPLGSTELVRCEVQPSASLNQDILDATYCIEPRLAPVVAATFMGGYADESPETIKQLQRCGVQVADMESSFLVEALARQDVSAAVIQIPQDIISRDASVARSFSAGKRNVEESYKAAFVLAFYALTN